MAQVNWSEKDEKYWVQDLKGENLFFDSVLDAANAARRVETERAVAQEVDLIVRWLRARLHNDAAESIAKGAYK